MRLEALKYLYDVQKACGLFSSFVAGKTFDDYVADALLRSGVERQLIIVGEALNRLMKIEAAMASSVTEVRQIIAFRNILVHGDDVVRNKVVWTILEKDLPALTRDVELLLGRGQGEQVAGDVADGEARIDEIGGLINRGRTLLLLSPAHLLRTLMLSARRFAPGTLLGSVRMGMMDKLSPRVWRRVIFGAFLVVGQSAHAQAPSAKLADYFGFQPLELYKLDNRIGNLQLKDLDGDKVDDIIVTNNGRSRIDLLLSTKKADDDKASRPFRKDPNELEYDRRMRLVSIPVNKEVVSVDTGDFNGDGKPDLVFYGTPAEVEILFNEGKGHFGSPKKINTGDAVQRPAALAVG